MPSSGFVKLWRISKQSTVWRNPKTWRVWTCMLMDAAWERTKVNICGTDVMIEPGQLIASRNSIARDTGLSPQNVRTTLTYLKLTNRITTLATKACTIITICNWAHYQASVNGNQPTLQPSNQPAINQGPTKDQPQRRTVEGEEPKKSGVYISIADALRMRNKTVKTRNDTRCDEITETMADLGELFNRRRSTRWTVAQVLTLDAIGPVPQEDVELLRQLHGGKDKPTEYTPKTSLSTLLNGWDMEMDKARQYIASITGQPPRPDQPDLNAAAVMGPVGPTADEIADTTRRLNAEKLEEDAAELARYQREHGE